MSFDSDLVSVSESENPPVGNIVKELLSSCYCCCCCWFCFCLSSTICCSNALSLPGLNAPGCCSWGISERISGLAGKFALFRNFSENRTTKDIWALIADEIQSIDRLLTLSSFGIRLVWFPNFDLMKQFSPIEL